MLLKNMKKKIQLANIVWKEGKYFVAQCLNMDVSSFGKTKSEALKNLEEAITLYLEDVPASHIQRVQQPSITMREFRHV